jgi:hypothetical protein
MKGLGNRSEDMMCRQVTCGPEIDEVRQLCNKDHYTLYASANIMAIINLL